MKLEDALPELRKGRHIRKSGSLLTFMLNEEGEVEGYVINSDGKEYLDRQGAMYYIDILEDNWEVVPKEEE